MRCARCLNEDPAYFYHGVNGWYCRRCISFGRAMIEEQESAVLCSIRDSSEEYVFTYPLTPGQREVSRRLEETIHEQDVLLKCVCGAGKTEMVVPTIAMYLSEKKKVCFAIARRQVVLEVAERLQKYFVNAHVVPVCQGFTKEVDGDLIVCTTHQLYRYYQAFDLLILDEPDAFPFRGNAVLHGIAETACRGHSVYLTATPDEQLMKRCREGSLLCIELNQRPHAKPIPVPSIRVGPVFLLFLILLRWIEMHDDSPRMIFVPTIAMAVRLQKVLSLLYECDMCTSKSIDRDEVIAAFRKKEHGIIVATTVLERGVTIPHADICVFAADHDIFDEAGLVQMAGRAGRSFEDPYGDVLFLCREKSDRCEKCRKSLQEANTSCGV